MKRPHPPAGAVVHASTTSAGCSWKESCRAGWFSGRRRAPSRRRPAERWRRCHPRRSSPRHRPGPRSRTSHGTLGPDHQSHTQTHTQTVLTQSSCAVVCLYVRLSVLKSLRLFIHSSICLSVCMSVCLSVLMSLRLFIHSSICLSVCLSVFSRLLPAPVTGYLRPH